MKLQRERFGANLLIGNVYGVLNLYSALTV
jgi:hypothetical protein